MPSSDDGSQASTAKPISDTRSVVSSVGIALTSEGEFDSHLYGTRSNDEYVSSIEPNADHDDEDDDEDTGLIEQAAKTASLGGGLKSYSIPQAMLKDMVGKGEETDPFSDTRPSKICDRESEYQKRRRKLAMSPERVDPFADGGRTPSVSNRTYVDVMKEQNLVKEQVEVRKKVNEKIEERKRRGRWDQVDSKYAETPGRTTPGGSSQVVDWAPTPLVGALSSDTTPVKASIQRRNRWDETPVERSEQESTPSGWADTPRGSVADEDLTTSAAKQKRRSRWDETPTGSAESTTSTHGFSAFGAATPLGTAARLLTTPTPGHLVMTPEQMQAYRWEKEIDERNRPVSDEELEAMFPPGYKVLKPPAGYVPIRTPARKLISTPTPMSVMGGFRMQTPDGYSQSAASSGGIASGIAGAIQEFMPKGGNLPLLKPDDLQYFDKLLQDVDEDSLSAEEQKERSIGTSTAKIYCF
ncbi:hypothetical protein ACOME3_001259 [Neoechinorhynchus agilis]